MALTSESFGKTKNTPLMRQQMIPTATIGSEGRAFQRGQKASVNNNVARNQEPKQIIATQMWGFKLSIGKIPTQPLARMVQMPNPASTYPSTSPPESETGGKK